ncbi:hypothetical protein [Altererythrobacter sp. TH136]|uniref:hypothetical protein n=1 Tax=Altererythrobacter sp. TH136 TaxID=2067415 RepID=UPI00116277D4|nr:hypothetical protein [Altererythrobacter sp. TH136]QDM41125.1 hypothetical protein C0V74_08820 [Altererythrobacter sp. TH136]
MKAWPLLAIAALGACAPTTGARVSTAPAAAPARAAAVPATRPAAPATGGFRPARVMNLPGLEGVIGADSAGLQRQFGVPRLDVWEGDARKLQFGSEACVLDVYLYPPAPGAAPKATYVDARRSSDGLDVDRAACVKALKR